MIRPGERVFVDTGAWIALAEKKDPLHDAARAQWEVLERAGARLVTSTLVVVETFTFLDRRASRTAALAWKESLSSVPRLNLIAISAGDLGEAWVYLDRKDLHRVSLVDATSFVLMRRQGIRVSFAFDSHFSVAGFRYVS